MTAKAVEGALWLVDGQASGYGWVLWEITFGNNFEQMKNPVLNLFHRNA